MFHIILKTKLPNNSTQLEHLEIKDALAVYNILDLKNYNEIYVHHKESDEEELTIKNLIIYQNYNKDK